MISLDMLYSSCQVGDNRDVEACKAFEGMLMISPYEPATESYENFKIEVHRRMPELNYSMKSPADVSIEFAELHTENCLSEICPEYYSRMFHFFLSLTQHNNRFSAALRPLFSFTLASRFCDRRIPSISFNVYRIMACVSCTDKYLQLLPTRCYHSVRLCFERLH